MDLDGSTGSTNELLYVGFNQDASCFACGTSSGFRIYSCNPFKETFQRDFIKGGIGKVEMLFRCNILAIVGGGPSPRYPPTKVMIWDDHQNRCIGELSFRSEVRGVRLRRDRIVVVLDTRVYVYNFADLARVQAISTALNRRGLCALAAGANNVLACPAEQKGVVRVELYDTGARQFIAAHESDVAALQLNASGTRLATASAKGTLIRIFDTSSGTLLHELRRGTEHTTIWSLAFNADSSMLASTSEKGTCHVFKLAAAVHDKAGAAAVLSGADADVTGPGGGSMVARAEETGTAEGGPAADGTGDGDEAGAGAASTTAAVLASATATATATTASGASASASSATPAPASAGFGELFSGVIPRFMVDDRSFAQFRVGAKKSICAFGAEPNTVIVVTDAGHYLKASFEGGGEAERIAYGPFAKGLRT